MLRISPTKGVQTLLYKWCPRTTLSWQKIAAITWNDSSACVHSLSGRLLWSIKLQNLSSRFKQQKVPDFAELLQDFHWSIIQARKVHKMTHLTSSCNINQTMVCFDMPRSKTNNVIGRKDIRIKHHKGRKEWLCLQHQLLERSYQQSFSSKRRVAVWVCELGEHSTYRTMSECVQLQMDGRQQ